MSKQLTGTIVSTKMQKTIVVRVERKLRHPLYRKVIMRYKKFKAHYEGTDLKEGDIVTIRETSPMSKEKRFIVVENGSDVKTVVAPKVEKKEEVKVEEAQAEVKAPEEKTVKPKAAPKKTAKKVTKAKK